MHGPQRWLSCEADLGGFKNDGGSIVKLMLPGRAVTTAGRWPLPKGNMEKMEM